MFLDAELEELAEAKARLAVQADLRRQVIHLELLTLCSRTRRSFTNLRFGFTVAGKVLDFLSARRKRREP
ncbi:hypothetical protein [Humidesulfovibrio sp.]